VARATIVITTASRPETEEWVRGLGAHHVIDHSRPLAAQVAALGIGAPAFVFSITHTEQHVADIAELIAPQGRFALIDDPVAHLSCDAEREVLWVLNGHCNSPVAGFATIAGTDMTLPASVLDEAGGQFIEVTRHGPANRPRELGRAVGLELLTKGAADIIARTRPGL
jgi:hypothetical protein